MRGEAPPCETLDAAELLRQLREAIDPQLLSAAASCETTLDCPPGRAVDVNRDGVIGAVLNLVDNALQAGGAGTRIGLRVVSRAGRIGIEVRDDGPGMSEEVLSRVGQDFFSTRPGGTGLGIAVVRSVARAHGGELDIHSRPGEGTRACLWLAATHCGDSHDD
ncbi:MAG: ATP-binding protein [Gammaproteobacteria bacterium]